MNAWGRRSEQPSCSAWKRTLRPTSLPRQGILYGDFLSWLGTRLDSFQPATGTGDNRPGDTPTLLPHVRTGLTERLRRRRYGHDARPGLCDDNDASSRRCHILPRHDVAEREPRPGRHPGQRPRARRSAGRFERLARAELLPGDPRRIPRDGALLRRVLSRRRPHHAVGQQERYLSGHRHRIGPGSSRHRSSRAVAPAPVFECLPGSAPGASQPAPSPRNAVGDQLLREPLSGIASRDPQHLPRRLGSDRSRAALQRRAWRPVAIQQRRRDRSRRRGCERNQRTVLRLRARAPVLAARDQRPVSGSSRATTPRSTRAAGSTSARSISRNSVTSC